MGRQNVFGNVVLGDVVISGDDATVVAGNVVYGDLTVTDTDQD